MECLRRAIFSTANCGALDLATITPSVAGPRRPQDRISLDEDQSQKFNDLLSRPVAESGYNKPFAEANKHFFVRTGVRKGETASPETPLSGGGEQDSDTIPDGTDALESVKDTSVITEIEMMQNRPTPDRVENVPDEEFPRKRWWTCITVTW